MDLDVRFEAMRRARDVRTHNGVRVGEVDEIRSRFGPAPRLIGAAQAEKYQCQYEQAPNSPLTQPEAVNETWRAWKGQRDPGK
jgi:hypothetical protein